MHLPGAAGGEDDAAQWRRTQSRRKARAKRFLEDPFSSFHLLTSLTLSAILAPVTNLCFKLVNSDKKGINSQLEVRAQKRLKRQMKAKGPAVFAEESSREVHFYNVKLQAEKCVRRLWAEMEELNLLTLAHHFCPEGDNSVKFNFLADNLLGCLAGVRWRILDKFQLPPWSLAHVAVPGCSDEDVPWQIVGVGTPALFMLDIWYKTSNPQRLCVSQFACGNRNCRTVALFLLKHW